MKVEGDEHAIVRVFAKALTENLKLMHPEEATKHAITSVQGFVNASKFIDMTSKDTPPGEREYLRVWKREEGSSGKV